MGHNNEIAKYIDYFNNKNIKFYEYKAGETKDGIFHMGYIKYDEGIEKFMEYFYDSDLVDSNYNDNLEKYRESIDSIAQLIDNADKDLLKSILTYYVKQEHFCDGIWAEAIEDGIFIKILEKLNS